ncbi:hydrolase 1, exosortase A system-associated [Roseateles toxinivorans]|uniref:Exosortase A-associated hydrolase 1 n=1 Tax=Roseateles toxinivorans TaxID=270368 RepID=A0A4R6QSU8_9BURK|nr:hydrolase 1, exosortase A system-associated [Roseateles toxinivorans]TDP74624.1 exosortase A-associated hydrolase 1 [Roseateles toxinivorans]
MNYTESALFFPVGSDLLLGLLALPEACLSTAVVVVVGGPQYRTGSHRQFLLLSRALAAAGHAVLRFDCAGMGDSAGEDRGFEDRQEEIAAAITLLQQQAPAVTRVVLWGLCDGASAALLYWQTSRDSRVRGLCLLNPWVRSESGLARTHVKHYYGQRLLQGAFWRKLCRGGVGWGRLAEFGANLVTMLRRKPSTSSPPYQARMSLAWADFPGRILLLLSGKDLTAREFIEHAQGDPHWAGLLSLAKVSRQDLPDADHTFSSAAARQQVETLTLQWLGTVT